MLLGNMKWQSTTNVRQKTTANERSCSRPISIFESKYFQEVKAEKWLPTWKWQILPLFFKFFRMNQGRYTNSFLRLFSMSLSSHRLACVYICMGLSVSLCGSFTYGITEGGLTKFFGYNAHSVTLLYTLYFDPTRQYKELWNLNQLKKTLRSFYVDSRFWLQNRTFYGRFVNVWMS